MRSWILCVGLLPVMGCEAPVHPAPSPAVAVRPAPAKTTHQFAVPVLMYHRICDLTAREATSPLLRDLSVSPAAFEAQVRFLRNEGFSFLLVSEVEQALRKGTALPERAVAITMDDGYRDNFTEALPILKKYGAVATIFMVTNNFDRPERLTWADARTMVNRGLSFQSHSVSHPDLTTLSNSQVRFELAESKSILEQGLDRSVSSVAYPAGAFNPMVIQVAEQVGYSAAWKKGGGAVQPHCSGKLYELPRIRVHGRTDLAKFRERVMSGTEIIAQQRAKARGQKLG